jgi:hypothetical protein
MSVGSLNSITGGSAAGSSSSTGQATSAADSPDGASAFSSLLNDGTPYDEVKVNLPNGMSVGIIHFGGGGFDSDMMKSIEDFVQKLADQQISGPSTSDAQQAQNDDKPDTVGIDKVHVDLPNGISFDVLHSSGGQASNSDAVIKELTEAAEELAESLGQYSPASSAASAYASQAASSGRNSQLDARS